MKKQNFKFVIPTSFTSGGFKVQVYYDPKMIESEKAEVGLNCLGTQEIYIQPPVKGRVSECVAKQAFMHELVHQITWAIGRTDLCHDEVFVDAFAHQLFQYTETAKGDLLGTWRKEEEKKKNG
jgi:hypothetical protein